MLLFYFEGVLLGLLVAVSVGPALFALLQTSIDRGFRSGQFMAAGISLSDLSLIGISYFGASQMFSNGSSRLAMGILGGVVLIIFGMFSFTRKPDILRRRSPKYKTPTDSPAFAYVMKGYLLNIANPFLIFFWLGAMSWVTSHAEVGKLHVYALVFFSGTITTVFGTDLLKCLLALKLKKFLRPRKLLMVNKITGLLLMVFGVVLMIRVLLEAF